MDEWHIGDPVDWGDGWMDAQNWGHGGDDGNDDHCSGSYGGHGSYGGYRPPVDIDQVNRNRLKSIKHNYESKLKEAREARNDELRIRCYGEALEYANRYSEQSEKWGITVEGMPDRSHALSKEDIDWISKRHYDEYGKLHILSTDQTENLERLLNESGNGHIIKSNEETRRIRNKEHAREMAIYHAEKLKKDYFKHLEKANELVLKGKFSKAMKEYRKAVSAHEEFFKRDIPNRIWRKMPEKSLNPEAVDNIMIIYKKTHPLLTSSKKHAEINREILDMLEGDWDDSLCEADVEVQEILHQKQLERQKRKEKVQEIGADAIVGARIVGDKILKRIRKRQ